MALWIPEEEITPEERAQIRKDYDLDNDPNYICVLSPEDYQIASIPEEVAVELELEGPVDLEPRIEVDTPNVDNDLLSILLDKKSRDVINAILER